MRQILDNELRKGDIFAHEMKINGRMAYIVTDIPEDKNYINVQERSEQRENKRLFIKDRHVILLKRDD